MTAKRTLIYLLPAILAVATAGFPANNSLSASETTVAILTGRTHLHGIAVDPRDRGRLYLATHHGMCVVGPDGAAQRVSETEDDFMGFTPLTTDPQVLYAIGHPTGSGNLSFIVSRDAVSPGPSSRTTSAARSTAIRCHDGG